MDELEDKECILWNTLWDKPNYLTVPVDFILMEFTAYAAGWIKEINTVLFFLKIAGFVQIHKNIMELFGKYGRLLYESVAVRYAMVRLPMDSADIP